MTTWASAQLESVSIAVLHCNLVLTFDAPGISLMAPGYVTHLAISAAVPFRFAMVETQSDELITSKHAYSVSTGHVFVKSCRIRSDGVASDDENSTENTKIAHFENMVG